MKGLTPALACGLFVAAGLYGLLAAIERDLPPPEDPWMEAWRDAGFNVAVHDPSAAPEEKLLSRDARELFEHRGAKLRRYALGGIPTDLVVLPDASVLEQEFPQGRHLKFRVFDKGTPVHLSRSGRQLLFVPTQYSGGVFGALRLTPDPDSLNRLFDVFEETAERYP